MSNTMAQFAMAPLAEADTVPGSAEEILQLRGAEGEPTLLVRHRRGPGPSILFVHGATFPSGLSVAYRIEGRSWMDDLRDRGFDTWAFDFAGYGGSDRLAPPVDHAAARQPVGRAADVGGQIERVARHVLATRGQRQLTLLAHSWGTLPAAMFAARSPEMLSRLILFGPVAERQGIREEAPAGATYAVSPADQWQSFQAGLPSGMPSLIAPEIFARWADAYLAGDPEAASRAVPAVMVPTGPQADIAEAWCGCLPYNPAEIRAPTLIVRGEWDSITRDADAEWLVRALSNVPGGAQDVKLARGAHRMHLEENRQALFDAVGAFATGLDEEAERPW